MTRTAAEVGHALCDEAAPAEIRVFLTARPRPPQGLASSASMNR